MSPEIDALNTCQGCGDEAVGRLYPIESERDWLGTNVKVSGDFAAQAPVDRPVLVVDDGPENRQFLRTLLTAEGYAVETASDGRDALLRLPQCAPAVIVLDLEMPVMDGLSFCHRLWRLPARFRHIPVILWSGSDRLDAIAAEVNAFAAYPKPLFDLPELLDTVAEAYRVGCVTSVPTAA